MAFEKHSFHRYEFVFIVIKERLFSSSPGKPGSKLVTTVFMRENEIPFWPYHLDLEFMVSPWNQGSRKYSPLRQPTAQQVMIEKISAGPITVFVIGAHTNFATFLMNNPHLKKNVEHIYVMGGGVRSKNPTGCCPKNASTSCQPRQCGDPGNLFTDYNSNPYAEFNIFGDPFAAYQVAEAIDF